MYEWGKLLLGRQELPGGHARHTFLDIGVRGAFNYYGAGAMQQLLVTSDVRSQCGIFEAPFLTDL